MLNINWSDLQSSAADNAAGVLRGSGSGPAGVGTAAIDYAIQQAELNGAWVGINLFLGGNAPAFAQTMQDPAAPVGADGQPLFPITSLDPFAGKAIKHGACWSSQPYRLAVQALMFALAAYVAGGSGPTLNQRRSFREMSISGVMSLYDEPHIQQVYDTSAGSGTWNQVNGPSAALAFMGGLAAFDAVLNQPRIMTLAQQYIADAKAAFPDTQLSYDFNPLGRILRGAGPIPLSSWPSQNALNLATSAFPIAAHDYQSGANNNTGVLVCRGAGAFTFAAEPVGGATVQIALAGAGKGFTDLGVVAGDIVYVFGTNYTVQSITDNTHLVLTGNVVAPTWAAALLGYQFFIIPAAANTNGNGTFAVSDNTADAGAGAGLTLTGGPAAPPASVANLYAVLVNLNQTGNGSGGNGDEATSATLMSTFVGMVPFGKLKNKSGRVSSIFTQAIGNLWGDMRAAAVNGLKALLGEQTASNTNLPGSYGGQDNNLKQILDNLIAAGFCDVELPTFYNVAYIGRAVTGTTGSATIVDGGGDNAQGGGPAVGALIVNSIGGNAAGVKVGLMYFPGSGNAYYILKNAAGNYTIYQQVGTPAQTTLLAADNGVQHVTVISWAAIAPTLPAGVPAAWQGNAQNYQSQMASLFPAFHGTRTRGGGGRSRSL